MRCTTLIDSASNCAGGMRLLCWRNLSTVDWDLQEIDTGIKEWCQRDLLFVLLLQNTSKGLQLNELQCPQLIHHETTFLDRSIVCQPDHFAPLRVSTCDIVLVWSSDEESILSVITILPKKYLCSLGTSFARIVDRLSLNAVVVGFDFWRKRNARETQFSARYHLIE